MREIYLPAEFRESEGLDGHWDIDDEETPEFNLALKILRDTEMPKDEAIKGLLSIMGTKLDDADLTKL